MDCRACNAQRLGDAWCFLPGQLEKVDRGVYVSADSIEDEMYSMQTKYSKLIAPMKQLFICMVFRIEPHLNIQPLFHVAIK